MIKSNNHKRGEKEHNMKNDFMSLKIRVYAFFIQVNR